MIKLFAKRILRSFIYRFPPIMMSPSRLYIWHDALVKTKEVAGDVLEVGCYLGGTAAVSARLLDAIGSPRPYSVLDTFAGFSRKQFDHEVVLGADPRLAKEFSSNSTDLTRWVLDRHGGSRVKIIKGDIAKLDTDELPSTISACLLDVDLAEPIYEGLKRIYPRLAPGGIIAVDDCGNIDGGYKAQIGYERFLAEIGVAPVYRYGMGLITKVANA